MKNFRKGDIVAIHGIVEFDFDPAANPGTSLEGKVSIRPHGHYSNIYVSADLAKIVRPHFIQGDIVVLGNADHGEVVATHEDMVWVKGADGGLDTWPATDIKIVSQTASPPAA